MRFAIIETIETRFMSVAAHDATTSNARHADCERRRTRARAHGTMNRALSMMIVYYFDALIDRWHNFFQAFLQIANNARAHANKDFSFRLLVAVVIIDWTLLSTTGSSLSSSSPRPHDLARASIRRTLARCRGDYFFAVCRLRARARRPSPLRDPLRRSHTRAHTIARHFPSLPIDYAP